MAAPAGNQFWKLRSKHGRDAIFTDANILWEAACEYFDWCVKNPIETVEFLGKDAQERIVPKCRAFSYAGLCLHLHINTKYFNDFKDTETGKQKDFSEVLTRIDDVLYCQKFTGAAANVLNPSIIARDLGLADKQEREHSGAVQLTQITGMQIE
jgi:DNA-packaging protein gp3